MRAFTRQSNQIKYFYFNVFALFVVLAGRRPPSGSVVCARPRDGPQVSLVRFVFKYAKSTIKKFPKISEKNIKKVPKNMRNKKSSQKYAKSTIKKITKKNAKTIAGSDSDAIERF